ncbi:2334_t:CDS:2 [Entrophospora sp. SA101]|nr:2334_t:CDS:2 [Entrophospora sp. SA101]
MSSRRKPFRTPHSSINIDKIASRRRKDFEHTLRDCDELLNFIARGYVYATESAVDLEEGGSEDETKLKIEKESIEKIIVKCDSGQEIDLLDSHEEEIKRLNIIFDNKSEKEKYFQNEHYNEFRQKVWDVNHQDEPMPPLDADADDDVVVGRQKESLKCPITTLLYEEPVTSNVCKHTFSKSAILQLISRNKDVVCCPIPGCDKQIMTHNLQPNKRMERKVAIAKRDDQMEDLENEVESDKLIGKKV